MLEESAQSGVCRMLFCGTSVTKSEAAHALAKQHNQYSTAGIHPHDAEATKDDAMERLRALAAEKRVTCIGECGLDFNRNYSSKKSQILCFEKQLELAEACRLPIYLHERDALEDMVAMLKNANLEHGGVIHCFTGGPHALEKYLDLGLHVGITGWVCDERRGLELRKSVPLIPKDRLLLETDAPYLLPRTIRPKPKSRTNLPKYLTYVADEVAALRDVSLRELSDTTEQNFNRLFTKVTPK